MVHFILIRCLATQDHSLLTQFMPSKDVLVPNLEMELWPSLQSLGCQVEVCGINREPWLLPGGGQKDTSYIGFNYYLTYRVGPLCKATILCRKQQGKVFTKYSGNPTCGWSTCVCPSCSPSRTVHALPIASPHLQKRVPDGKPLAPTSSPIKCTSAIFQISFPDQICLGTIRRSTPAPFHGGPKFIHLLCHDYNTCKRGVAAHLTCRCSIV